MADIIQSPPQAPSQSAEILEALGEIERQVLWLSTAIIHHANRVRPNPGGMKVGGHQASSASMVSIMTSLWFGHLRAQDRVSVKPHASPVLHAINYLLGELDESYLPTLRAFAGLQSYPSRVKDPDPVDYSTGSVGIGATAPI
jgi:pyruvate dehydrogenase E1 component